MFPQAADKWDLRFLELALLVRTWSKDPSTQHATVIVRPDHSICSVGYNGFPRRMRREESEFVYAKTGDFAAADDEADRIRQEKYSRVVHGEMNALMSSRDESVGGYTAYVVSGVGCDRCTIHLIQAGIARLVFLDAGPDYWKRWGHLAQRSLDYLTECKVPWDIVNVESKIVVRSG